MATPEEDAITNMPAPKREAWREITDLIYNAGYRHGYKIGWGDNKANYSLGFRARFQTGNFILGLVLGGTVGSMLLIIVLKSSGVLG